MESKKLQVGELSINYYKSEGTGSPVVLVHGNSASGRTFARQLEGNFGAKYQVYAPDLPGHGLSDRAADPMATYHMPGYAKAIVGFAKALGLEDAVFVGWSLGGHIVLEAAPALPQAKGFVIYGTPPLGIPPAMDKGFLPNPAMGAALKGELSEAEITAFGESSLKPGDTPATGFYEDMSRTDGRARESLAVSVGTANFADEIAIVANLKQPLAILHGEHEQLVNGDYFSSLTAPTLWRGAVQIIKDSGHSPQLEQAEKFNALLDEFIQEVS
jgi:pimeloyl-ACP methyl ester carboxylesterase